MRFSEYARSFAVSSDAGRYLHALGDYWGMWNMKPNTCENYIRLQSCVVNIYLFGIW